MAIQDSFERLEAFATGPFEGLCTPAEIAEVFHVDESAIRHAIRNGRLEPGKDCFKFGKQWVLSKYAFPKLTRMGSWAKHSEIITDYHKAKKIHDTENFS